MKYLSTFIFSFLFLNSFVLAAEINFSADKTEITTDDILKIHLSVDGEIDGNQIGIKGLDNFKIVGQRSSSQIQIINNSMTSVQEKIISLSPNSDGDFTLFALAKEDGKEIKSSPIKIHVKKSLIQSTKEKLLEDSSKEDTNNPEENIEEKEDFVKNLLKSTPERIDTKINNSPNNQLETLKQPQLKSFPKIQHISAFNIKFWLEFFGILGFIAVLIYSIWLKFSSS